MMTVHSLTYRVRYADTDAGGVVYNANYLKYFEIGRSEMMREHVCSYKVIEDAGILLPVTESFTRYKAPAHYDDLLIIETEVTELKKFTCKFSYRISRDDGSKRPRLIARGYTVHAGINQEGKLVVLPEEIHAKIALLIAKS
ncbi:acyl-CoA thioesterase [Desulfotalea psychrophila]|uniref:Uncharacterized protein n=1 Tax=Desulfotalea psychrophila (strain LSv54 / DSM 12343) TaxID=177439 RepID=Q6AMG6_DESPS|nr:thioesterase family protein [Desulfotalea psychrophila]CAG36459.1 conserved hypothetical protein [Desulfotalea psychrophila LSv54]